MQYSELNNNDLIDIINKLEKENLKYKIALTEISKISTLKSKKYNSLLNNKECKLKLYESKIYLCERLLQKQNYYYNYNNSLVDKNTLLHKEIINLKNLLQIKDTQIQNKTLIDDYAKLKLQLINLKNLLQIKDNQLNNSQIQHKTVIDDYDKLKLQFINLKNLLQIKDNEIYYLSCINNNINNNATNVNNINNNNIINNNNNNYVLIPYVYYQYYDGNTIYYIEK